MFKRSFSRGSSILAALVFIGILGAVAYGVQMLPVPNNSASQGAQAGEAYRTAPAGPTAKGVSAACDTAKRSAAAQGKSQGAETIRNTPENDNDLIDDCVSAILDTSKRNPNPRDPNSYKCVGKSAVVSIDRKEVITDRSVPNAGQPAGRCQVKACSPTEDGEKLTCFDTTMGTVSFGAIKTSFGGGNEGVNLFTAEKSSMNKLYDSVTGLPVDFANQSALDKAFGALQETTQVQIQDNDKAITDLQKQIEAGNLPASEMSQEQLAELQKKRQELENKNSELKTQMGALADAQRSDLDPTAKVNATPDQTLDCSSQDNANNPRCYPGLTGNKTGGCPVGQINLGGTCKPQNTTLGNGGGGGGTKEEPDEKTNKGGGFNDILKSMLGGLMKGLTGAGAATGAACPSDPSAYQQQQQQYNQQLQQYNQQLQQYNYQQQMSQYNGLPAPVAPVAPVPCQQTSSSNTCAAAPAQPAASGCSNGTWKPVTTQQSNGAQCTTSWQCVPGGSGATPTAEISCQPKIADVGMSIAISFRCTNAATSTGSGFDTQGATSGSATTTLANPPAGANTANFGITCINQSLIGQAQCSVQIARPSIVLVANPRIVASGASSTIGWVTSGMSSCVVSSPDMPAFTAQNANNTSVNGMAATLPLTSGVRVLLHCVTVGGGTRDATTTVSVSGVPDNFGDGQGTVTVSSSIDNATTSRGSTANIQWSSVNPPSGSKMSLWLYDVRLGMTTALIKNELAASSTYVWVLPTATSSCDTSSNLVCGTDLLPGRQYGIEADLYTGSATQPVYGDFDHTDDVFTIGQ